TEGRRGHAAGRRSGRSARQTGAGVGAGGRGAFANGARLGKAREHLPQAHAYGGGGLDENDLSHRAAGAGVILGGAERVRDHRIVLAIDGLLFNAFAVGGGSKRSSEVLSLFFYFSAGTTMVASVFISMRLLAEERQAGTLNLLYSSPVRDGEIVLGKFL